jgi:hypothetical protein
MIGSGKENKADFWQNPQHQIEFSRFKFSNKNEPNTNVIISIMQMGQVNRRLRKDGEYSESNLPVIFFLFF